MDIRLMRSEISKVYDVDDWRKKVMSMPDNQIIAIYHRMQQSGTLAEAAKRRRQKLNEPEYHQITLNEYFGGM